ncbi:hypothetical protein [Algirhabdus cladophorae]|uniref:hypothetical protein n=1 Tax=Algirhabdus cladophorae TaxID=3377108 RepID=UPI003B845D48
MQNRVAVHQLGENLMEILHKGLSGLTGTNAGGIPDAIIAGTVLVHLPNDTGDNVLTNFTANAAGGIAPDADALLTAPTLTTHKPKGVTNDRKAHRSKNE